MNLKIGTQIISKLARAFEILFIYIWGRDSAVGKATRYGLDGPGIESRCEKRFSAFVQIDPGGPTQPLVQWVPGLSPEVKRPGRGADHPHSYKCRD
jgi:hypothetical protein